MNGAVIPNLNNSNFLMGNTTAGTTGGANSYNLQHTHGLADHSHGLNGTHYHTVGGSSASINYASGSYNLSNILLGSGAMAYANLPEGNVNTNGSGALTTGNGLSSSTDLRPAYITTKFVMRIK